MEDLVIEKVNKTVGGGENGTSAAQSQVDLIKILQSRAAGISGAMAGVGNLGGLTATQSRSNGSQLMRSYEALLQRSQASARIPTQTVTLPGPTRRRKKKRRRQPDMPKKACTPFMHFCAYFKRKLMEEGKEFPQFADFGKRAGELWRNMGDEEKLRFNELSELDRQRYMKDMKEYEARKLAEKERERELQQQREQELQALREKEIERLQKQQREQMEQQQKHIEQQKSQTSNQSLLNMMNPVNSLSPLMIAALNQSLLQTMLTNPDLFKTIYNEAAKNYYLESLKNAYQASSNMNGGNNIPSSATGLSGMDVPPVSTSAMSSNQMISANMNLSLINLLRQSQMLAPNASRQSPSPKASSPSNNKPNSPISPSTNLASTALDLSASRSDVRGSCSSEEDMNKEEM